MGNLNSINEIDTEGEYVINVNSIGEVDKIHISNVCCQKVGNASNKLEE